MMTKKAVAATAAVGNDSSRSTVPTLTRRTRSATAKADQVATATAKNSASTTANKKVTVKKTARATAVAPADLVVRDDESPWTATELDEVRAELTADVERLQAELRTIEADIAGLVKDSSSGAGDDQADVGSKAFERDHEYQLAQNNRSSLAQAQHALERIEDGSFGVCENCGNPIGKMRLQAFPRATLCMACKQKERR